MLKRDETSVRSKLKKGENRQLISVPSPLSSQKKAINFRQRDYCKSLEEDSLFRAEETSSLTINNEKQLFDIAQTLSACSSLRIKLYESASVEIYGFLNGSQADL